MPVEFTEAEKIKVEEHLKELGFDAHAREVIARVQAEAKTHREAKDVLDKAVKERDDKIKTLETKENERVEKQKKIDEDAAAKQKLIDDEKKTLEERLADIKKTIDDKVGEATAAQQKEIKALVKQITERDEKLSKRDGIILMRTIKSAADKRGILDTDLVEHLDLKDIKVEDGEPDMASIEKLIDEHAKAKPHLYKDPNSREMIEKRFSGPAAPDRNTQPNNGIDFGKLSDEEFDRRESELRAVRV